MLPSAIFDVVSTTLPFAPFTVVTPPTILITPVILSYVPAPITDIAVLTLELV